MFIEYNKDSQINVFSIFEESGLRHHNNDAIIDTEDYEDNINNDDFSRFDKIKAYNEVLKNLEIDIYFNFNVFIYTIPTIILVVTPLSKSILLSRDIFILHLVITLFRYLYRCILLHIRP